MNVLSLFSGIGGLELGLERAGMATVGQVEIDAYCRRVLAKHWPDVPRHDDVRTAADWWLSTERPTVDVICGGFPCQDISSAGRRAGIIDGEKSYLWTYLAHTVRVLRPRYVLVENVAAILVRGLDVVAGDLAEIGYDLRWDCVPAAALGAPHRRDRWFGIAYPSRGVGPDEPVSGDSARVALGAVTGPSGRANGRSASARVGEPGRSAGIVGAAVADSPGAGSPWRHGGTRRVPSETRRLESERLGNRGAWQRPAPSRHWASEPDVGRVAHGIPDRVDRLRALGNAVVPQVSEYVGRLIVEHATAETA